MAKVKRHTLEPNIVKEFKFDETYQEFDIQNFGQIDGNGHIYIDYEQDPAIDGTNSIYIPDGKGYSLKVTTNTIKVISSGTPLVQIIPVKRDF